MNTKNGEKNSALIPRPSSAVEKFEPGAKRVLALMVSDTLAIAQKHLTPAVTSPTKAELEKWCRIGNKYYWGHGVPKNYAEALKWFRKAAEQGHAIAQNYIGNCHYCGYGVQQDHTEAVKWYRKAAEQGERAAQANLGHCCEYGLGVHKANVEAYKWYKISSEGSGFVSELTSRMSPQQIAEGERRCKEFKAIHKT